MIQYRPWPDGWNYGGAKLIHDYFEFAYPEKKFLMIQFPWPCVDTEDYEKNIFTKNSNHIPWVVAKQSLSEIDFDYIIIYEPVEWTFTTEVIDDYYDFFESCNIPMDKIIFQGANHEVKKYYDHAHIEKKKRFKSVGFNHCLISSLTSHTDILNQHTTEVKFDGNKLFICPMNVHGDHREFLYDELKENDLLKSGNVSARWKGVYLDEQGSATCENLPHMNFVKSIIPFYEDSFCSVVTESEFDSWNVRFTEKFYFPIMYNRPFMVLGSPKLIKWIKEYGFKTFPELFDEGYDDENDLKKRTKLIVKNLKRLQDKSKKELQDLLEIVKPKIIHNKNILKKYANFDRNQGEYTKKELFKTMNIPLEKQLRGVL